MPLSKTRLSNAYHVKVSSTDNIQIGAKTLYSTGDNSYDDGVTTNLWIKTSKRPLKKNET